MKTITEAELLNAMLSSCDFLEEISELDDYTLMHDTPDYVFVRDLLKWSDKKMCKEMRKHAEWIKEDDYEDL